MIVAAWPPSFEVDRFGSPFVRAAAGAVESGENEVAGVEDPRRGAAQLRPRGRLRLSLWESTRTAMRRRPVCSGYDWL